MDVSDRIDGARYDGAWELLEVAVPAGGGPVLGQDYRRFAVFFMEDDATAYHVSVQKTLPAGVGFPVNNVVGMQRFDREHDGHIVTGPWFARSDGGAAFTCRIAVSIMRDWGVSRAFEQSKPLEDAPVGATITESPLYGEH